MKVIVRIHKPSGLLEFKTKKIESDGTIILRKGGRGKTKWRPKLIGYETKPLHLGRVKYFADVWDEAKETWQYKSGLTPEQQPELTQAQVERYAKTKVFERRYQTDTAQKGSMLIYLIFFAQIITIVMMYLFFSGRM